MPGDSSANYAGANCRGPVLYGGNITVGEHPGGLQRAPVAGDVDDEWRPGQGG